MSAGERMGTMKEPVYIEVVAGVRYWEDATVNGVEDEDGKLIPCRKDGVWCPVIRLADGAVMDWPKGTVADIHYKICDSGEYFLLDEHKNRIAKWDWDYVPSRFLCVGDNGFGDYIIFTVNGDGMIPGWKEPIIIPEDWNEEE